MLLDLSLPPGERRLLADLVGAWKDLLYVPGPDLASPLDPGCYRSTFFVVTADGPMVRLSSLARPAFARDLCRLRVEPVAEVRADRLGSFFEPARRGQVYAMGPDRAGGALAPPGRPGWSYDGPSLVASLGVVTRLRLLRERGRARSGDGEVEWTAHRGLVMAGTLSAASVFLAEPEDDARAVFLPDPAGPYRILADPRAPTPPGAGVREVLGHGDWTEAREVSLELEEP